MIYIFFYLFCIITTKELNGLSLIKFSTQSIHITIIIQPTFGVQFGLYTNANYSLLIPELE